MPVEFLSDQQAASFGRFTSAPSSRELARWCWLDDADRRMIAQHRRDSNRLGFAVQLATVRMLGTFLPDPLDVPWQLVTFMANQLGVADPSSVKTYTGRAKTPYEHQWEIAQAFNYRPWSDANGQRELRAFLAARAWTSAEPCTTLHDGI